MHEFQKVPKNTYNTENTNINQLDFPVNEMVFIAAQYHIVDKEYKCLKLRFHVVLRKREEEIWSLVEIMRVLNISKDVLFEGML